MRAHPRVNGIGTAAADHIFTQEETKVFFTELFRKGLDNVDELSSVFDNARIKTRHFCEPLELLAQDNGFDVKNRLVIQHASALAAKAAREAIEDAGLQPMDIEYLVYVCSSGVVVPGLDVILIQEIGLSRNVARKPLFGLGCAGGAAGISHAADIARSHPGQNVLLVAVEPNMLTFQSQDLSRTNFISTSLFSDGGAAVILNTWGSGPKLMGRHNTLLPSSEWVLGWDIIESGLKVRISHELPNVVRTHLPQLFEDACDKWGISRQQIKHFILHPGGARVLDGFASTLDLTEKNMEESAWVLENYGNMSSPTVLFVLERFLKAHPTQTGDYGFLIGFGPGFSTDQALLQW